MNTSLPPLNPAPPAQRQLTLPRVKSATGPLEPAFLTQLAEVFGLQVFIETGTFMGNTTAIAGGVFSEVHTIELSAELAAKARARFAEQPRIRVHQGDSAELLSKILARLTTPALFWLDGHYSEGITARGRSNTPILDEIAAIARSGRKDAVILVDDLRLFERRPLSVGAASSLHGYPTVNELHAAVRAIDPDYQFFVFGDVALAFPGTAGVTVSPLILALTISRLFDGNNLPEDEVIAAECLLAQASGGEREVLGELPAAFAATESHGLGLHYRLWQAHALFGEGKVPEAKHHFQEVLRLGFNHWRVRWYLAVASHAAGDHRLAGELLDALLQIVPDFAAARELRQTLTLPAPAPVPATASERPLLAPGQNALAQLVAAGIHRAGGSLRLHLGCGEQHFDGYVNIDYPPSEHSCQTRIGADVFADITKLQFPPQSVDEIRLHHVFEHFKRAEALALLIRWHETLKLGGRLHLETPDLDGCAHQLVSEIPFAVKQVVIRHCFGSQEAGWANHYDGWTAERYQHVLSRFGFNVQTKNWSWPHPPHLANVEAVATKKQNLSRSELLAVADEILSEYMTVDVPSERGMCEVWCQAMRDFLAASEPPPAPKAPQNQPVEIAILPPSPASEAAGFDDDNCATNGENFVIKSLLRPGQLVLDVGANVGDWSRQALACAPGIRLHSFEPAPDTFATLQKNLSGQDVTLHQVALSERAGETTLFRYADRPEFSGMNSRYRRPEVEQRLRLQTAPTTVSTQTLDEFCTQENFNLIDFLKIDTEGSELDVLRGAQNLLANGRLKLIQFEYGGTYRDAGITLRQVHELLAAADYQLFRIAAKGLVAIPQWNEQLENYRYANYLAVAPKFVAGDATPTGEVVVKLQGGLGNQMFQYAAGLAVARHHGARLKLDLSFLRDRTPRPNFTQRDFCLDLFRLPADCDIIPDASKSVKHLQRHVEQQFHFDPKFNQLGANVYLDGYFQSPRFFEPVQAEVRRTFKSFATPLNAEQQALAEKISACQSVCLNVRRGDYVANPVANSFHGVCDESYFHPAVAAIRQRVPDPHFFIFSDDVEWCRTANLTNGAPFTLVPHNFAGDRFGAYLQLMTACRHFILPNSSFGWWAAFLSSAPDKIVIIPEPWFDNPVNNTVDLFPAGWIRLPKKPAAAPAVTIVISCHNYAQFLPEAVACAWSQTFRNFEIIAVDDGSTDDSLAVAHRLAAETPPGISFRVVRLEDVGPTAARRFGVAQARGKYFLPLDADDRIAPDFLAKTMPLLEADEKLGFVYVDTVFFGNQQQRHHQPEYDFPRLCQGNFISHTSLIRKAAFDAVGGYDPENWGYYEDWDLWIRLGSQGWFGKHLGEPLFFYRHHFNSSLSLFACRLDPVYKAFLQSRHPELYPKPLIDAAQQTLAEMPLGWNLRPPMRNIDQLQSLRAQHPQNRHVLYFLGCALAKSGARAEAETVFKKLLAMHPNDTQAQEVMKQLSAGSAPQNPALVSVIVPTYNRPDWLGETLRSILAQTYRDFEIIVVNDAGPDVSHILEPLNADGRIRLINHPKNKGLAGARNTGIRAARGQYIAYLDDDDIFHPQHLATLMGQLAATGAPVVYSDSHRAVQRKEGDRYEVVERTVLYSHDWNNDKILVHNFVPVLCFLHEKRCVEQAGWFDESLTTHEDWDLWMRMSRLFNFSHIKEVTCEFRWRDDGSSMSSARRADFLRTANVIYNKNPKLVEGRLDIQLRRQQHLLEVSRAIGAVPGKPTPDCLLVSIVIPVFNRLDMTRPCLEAIQRETAACTFELIVVDNASSDGTREFLAAEQAAGRLRTIRNEENRGFSKACNQGIRAARGGFILLLNNDTVPLAGWLDAMLDEIVTHAKIGAVGSCLLYPGGELIQHAGVQIGAGNGLVHPYHPWRLQRLDRVPAAQQSRDCQVVTGACLLIRRTVLDEVGLLDEAYINGFEDVDLCFRIRQARRRIRYCAKSRVIHHESMTPGRSAHEQANYNRLNERWKTLIKPDETPPETGSQVGEIQCRERLLTEPENPCVLAALAQICTRRQDHAQAAEWQAQLMKVTRNGTAVPVAVTIVIPVLNNLAMTKQCVQSIESAGGLVTVEIIVVDNGSTDGTPEFLQEAKRKGRLNFLRNETNQGFARACNQGAARAHANLLLFLNNDTEVVPGWINALLAAAKKPEVGIVGAKLLYANKTIQHAGIGWINGVPDHPHRHAQPFAPEVNTPRELDMVTGACLLIHRDLFTQLAGFDEIYRNGVEDIDLCLRARSAGRKVYYEPAAVVFHLEGQSAGRFNHVNENLKIFFERWTKSFDQKKNFVVPNPLKLIAASRSFLRDQSNARPTGSGKQNAVISWEGSFLDHGSLSLVNRELVGALTAASAAQIHCVSNGAPAAADAGKAWPQFASALKTVPAPDAGITVRHAWPPNWKRVRQGKLVVIQPWEFGALPEDWVRQSRDVDEFWLPSEYVRRVYVDSGVPAEKVFVVPNGVDAEKFHPQAAPMKLATAKQFKFLFVGGTIGRKGPDLLLQAYLQNFTAADDVCLVIKDFGGQSVYTGQTFEAQIRAAQTLSNAPEILYLNAELPPEQLPGLYTACDCLVLPYRGEGFGLPALEAMACGRPVIVTAGGATDDFVRDEFAWRIPAERKIFGHEAGGLKLVQPGWLLEPNLAALGEKMRHAFANPAEAQQRGQLASRHAHQCWSWKTAAAIAAKRIQVLAAKPTATAKTAAPVALPAVAAVGQLAEARELFGQKKFAAAWASVLTAITKRPFHPEGFLLLAEIALAAGDGKNAKLCAQRARDYAPGWNRPKQFLSKPLKGGAKPEWLVLPDQIGNRQLAIGNKLSMCLIAKNEEKFLEQCLRSVHGLASQIVLLDTGSTDRTIEIARQYGAEVHTLAWADDFSAARNAALAHATGDWILMLDADEELPAEQHPKLLADLKNSGVIAFRLPLVNRGQENEGRSFVPRLFRNLPGVFFHGRIHEQVFPSLLPPAKNWGLRTALGAAELLHHGYSQEMVRDRNKVERNLKLLRTAVLENPEDANLMMNFGLELVRSGDLHGGIEKYREAFALMSAQPAAEVVPELREALLTQFVCQLYKVNGHEEVVRVLTSPLAKNGGLTASLHLSFGLSQFELKDYSAAADQMRHVLAKRKQPALTPVNVGIHGAAPLHCLALCHARTGEVTGAEKHFTEAVAAPSHANEARVDFAKFLLEQQRPTEALQTLHAAITADAQYVPAWRLGGEIALGRVEFLEFARDWTGEAFKNLPGNPVIAAQRAEALMLNGDTVAAAEIWEKIWRSEPDARPLAALILCENLGAPTGHAPKAGEEELATSRAFIAWYQKLIGVHAHALTGRVNEQLEKLSRALPSAAQMLEAALAEAATPAAV
jgi:FkbM family methyltransferase